MKFEVDGWNNFCRVFEVPKEFPNAYCFEGGHAVEFKMVDWFNPTDMGTAAVSKEVWEREVGPIETQVIDMDELSEVLDHFLQEKTYIIPGRQYLVLCDFGGTFSFVGRSKPKPNVINESGPGRWA